MKKVVLPLVTLLLTAAGVQAQEETSKKGNADFNKWSIEANAGLTKAVNVGGVNLNSGFGANMGFRHYDLGVRYMPGTKFGLKIDAAYDGIKSADNTPEFKTSIWRFGLQGVVNLGRVLSFEEWTNSFNVLFHAGPAFSMLKTDAEDDDAMIAAVAGLTFQVKLSDRFALTLDGSVANHFLMSKTFNGQNRDPKSLSSTVTVNGETVTVSLPDPSADYLKHIAPVVSASVGITYYFGDKKHADWYIKETVSKNELDEAAARIDELETMMNDSDKDGVPDYLDAEPNTIAGVAVDSKGRTIDRNGNGVPDELENYVDRKNAETKQEIQQGIKAGLADLINGGYVNVYFDFNRDTPNAQSTSGINFLIKYLKDNPSATADVVGYADEIGNNEYNRSLSSRRATNVKKILVDAGIDASRLNIVGNGEDTSVNKNNKYARQTVRRVTFILK